MEPKDVTTAVRNAITRRSLLRGSAAFAAATFVPGPAAFALRSAFVKPTGLHPFFSCSSNPQTGPGGSDTVIQATLAITSTVAQGPIPARFVGLSYEKSYMTVAYTGSGGSGHSFLSSYNTALVNLFKLLGPGVLRIGGGSGDTYTWNTGSTAIANTVMAGNVADLAGFLTATGWKCIYCINLQASAPSGIPTGFYATSTTLAGDEATSVVSNLSSSLMGFEIGNEPDVYNDAASGSYYGHTGFAFTNTNNALSYSYQWQRYYNAVSASGGKVTGPADASHEGGTFDGGSGNWTGQFDTSFHTDVDLLTQHYYRPLDPTYDTNNTGYTLTAAELLAVAQYLVSPDSNLTSALGDVFSDADSNLSYRISECNSFPGGGVLNVSNAYASAIWAINFMFTCAQNFASGVNFHGSGDANGYTPIADHGGVVTEVRPEFYGIYLFALAIAENLTFSLLKNTFTVGTGNATATAYAIEVTGGLNIVVNNTNQLGSNDWLEVTVTLPTAYSNANLYQMTQSSYNLIATSTADTGDSPNNVGGYYIQGATITSSGTLSTALNPNTICLTGGGETLTFYVQPASAVLVMLT